MCTGVRFSDGEHMYFGRNLDWSCGYGEKVVITPKGYSLNSPFGATKVEHPVIGMGIVEDATPLYFDCANDRGLAVAGLNFPGYAKYDSMPVDGYTNVAAWEFPLWVMQFSSVGEVYANLFELAIVDKPINDKFPSSMLHWIIGDAKRSIVVEYTERGCEVFDNPFDVLANQPSFAWHEENVRNYLNVSSEVPEGVEWGTAKLEPYGSGGCMRGLPGDYYSPSRFVRAAYLNANYPLKDNEDENVTRMFKTLGGVSMIDGAAKMANGEFEKTIYSSCFSTKTRTYYYSTYDDPAIKAFELRDSEKLEVLG